jgi:hypothetical protein
MIYPSPYADPESCSVIAEPTPWQLINRTYRFVDLCLPEHGNTMPATHQINSLADAFDRLAAKESESRAFWAIPRPAEEGNFPDFKRYTQMLLEAAGRICAHYEDYAPYFCKLWNDLYNT